MKARLYYFWNLESDATKTVTIKGALLMRSSERARQSNSREGLRVLAFRGLRV